MFSPTDEQLAAVEMFRGGDSLAIEAGAGTGKTSTLMLLGSVDPYRRGMYVAFNKAIVTEAGEKMPRSVTCSTAHSLAYRAVVATEGGRAYATRLRGSRMKSNEIAGILRIDPITVHTAHRAKPMAKGFLANLVMRAITRFCQTADPNPGIEHVPYIDGIDEPLSDGRRTYDNNMIVRRHIEHAIARAWGEIVDPNGQLPFRHDHYLKMWQLQGPKIDADYILFDEAQDASPVMTAIVSAQDHAQKVWVGDSCQPPGTMVRVVTGGTGQRGSPYDVEERPIEQLAVGDRVVSYDLRTGHLHRAGRPITGITRRPFDGELIVVNGVTSYTPDHRCIVRIEDAFAGKHVVYLMRRGGDFRVGRTLGQHIKQGHRLGISLRGRQEGADAVWVLGVHPTAADAAEHEHTVAWRYGLPTLTFRWSRGILSQGALDRFWRTNGGNEGQAKACLADHARDIAYPFWTFEDGNLLRRRPMRIRAINLLDGMAMLPVDEAAMRYGRSMVRRHWQPIRIEREPYSGDVWSLDVADHHTYVADGLVTANCQAIYEFTGAVNALADVPADRRTLLTHSFRFGPQIAGIANGILEVLGADLRLTGRGRPGVIGQIADPDVLLTRTNATGVQTMFFELAQGRRPAIVGGAADVLAFARAATELREKGWTSHQDLTCFTSWGEVQDYCLAPGTRVLTSDLRWQAIELLEPGDTLVAFDEDNQPPNMGRRFRTARVEQKNLIARPSVRIHLTDGRSVVASTDHRWLAYSGHNLRWVQTEYVRPGTVLASIGCWDEERTKEAGWLAGMFDGEGYVGGNYATSRSRHLSIAQNEGPVLDDLRRLLKDRSFLLGDYPSGDCRQLTIRGGITEQLRLLGTVRPERLIAKAGRLWEDKRVERIAAATVVGLEPVGVQPVVAVRTDTGTFIAEGLLSHNCSNDEGGSDLALLVKLIDEFGSERIASALDNMPREADADLLISTAHKAKGREWPAVKLAGDFPDPQVREMDPSEWRLLYVACTRARTRLDATDCPHALDPRGADDAAFSGGR